MDYSFVLMFLCFPIGFTTCRKVSLPAGPLMRVEGQTLSLRCEVSDYEGPKEQDFEWKATKGSETIQVISTFDPLFPDQSVMDRVNTKDISVERLGDSSVELRIRETRVTDSAVFTCSTPSTDSIISGNYGAMVQLRVIPNTLVVVPEPLSSLVHEGRNFSLRCNVSHDVVDGINLSITWTVKKDLTEEDLLTFGPDLSITVGRNFTQRYLDGEMCLQLETRGSYSLLIFGTVLADHGMYMCTARQWTREQDTWNRIQEKTEIIGEVAIIPIAESIRVQILDNTILIVGDDLNLTCVVYADDYSVLKLEVIWLLNDTLVLSHLGKDGVEVKSSNVFSMSQVGEGEFRMDINRVEKSDMGLYSCRVKAWVQHSRGQWYNAAEKTSAPVEVIVNLIDPVFSVFLDSSVIAQHIYDPMELVCQVSNSSNIRGKLLGVSWFFSTVSSDNGQLPSNVITSLNENGANIPSEEYRSRINEGHILLTRQEPATFKLRLLHTTSRDTGVYACSVTTWIFTRFDRWKKNSEYYSNAVNVNLSSIGFGMNVIAHHLRHATFIGSTFKMYCKARTKSLQQDMTLSILILFQSDVSAARKKLASLSPDLIFMVEDWYPSIQHDKLRLVKTGKEEFQFQIHDVELTDRGFYSCEVAVWTKQSKNDWLEMAKGESNRMHLTFENTRPSFELSITLDPAIIYPWETVKLECTTTVSGISFNINNVAYETRWYHSQLSGLDDYTLLASIDRWGVVKTPCNNISYCCLERLRPQTFTLNIYSTQNTDEGEYYCVVTPWIRLGSTDTWKKESEIMSKRVFLSVRFSLWSSMKLPLLYGSCISLTVGLFSLILGLIYAHCGYKKNIHTPHARKLISPQTD